MGEKNNNNTVSQAYPIFSGLSNYSFPEVNNKITNNNILTTLLNLNVVSVYSIDE